MKMSGNGMTIESILLAGIYDNTKVIAWLNSSDGSEGINRPMPILDALSKKSANDESEIVTFRTGEDFDREWKRLTGGAENGNISS